MEGNTLFFIILSLHIFLCIILVCLILLQQGKGASLGAAFGGSGNTLFGAVGATSIMVKLTTVVAVLFMITSIVLIRQYSAGMITEAKPVSNPFQAEGMQPGVLPPLTGDVVNGVVDGARVDGAPVGEPAVGSKDLEDGAVVKIE